MTYDAGVSILVSCDLVKSGSFDLRSFLIVPLFIQMVNASGRSMYSFNTSRASTGKPLDSSTSVGYYKGAIVSITMLHKNEITLTRHDLLQIKLVRSLK